MKINSSAEYKVIEYICHCLPPDKTWHKVNDLRVDYSWGLGEGKVGHKPQVCLCWS